MNFIIKGVFLIFLIGLFSNTNGQNIDLTFCNVDAIVPDPLNLPFPRANISSRFQVNVERNNALTRTTEEIYELYDGVDNLGISTNLASGVPTSIYSYYGVNELLFVIGQNCRTLKLNESYSLSPFYVTNVNGQEHIISQLGLLLLGNFKLVYIGASEVRGVIVNNWQTCVYSPNDKATLKITISLSNPDKWNPTLQTPVKIPIPIQSKIEAKKSETNEIYTEFLSYTRFRPGILVNEENFFTPRGVYCPDRKNIKPVPQINFRSFSAVSSVVIPDNLGFTGTILTTRIEYDFDNKLFRSDVVLPTGILTQIDDFNTGVKYKFNRASNLCEISIIGNDDYDAEIGSNIINIKDPMEFFNFNGTPEFYYVGLRRIKGIETDVWISKRKLAGLDGIWEWHFMSDNYVAQESNAAKKNEPILLAVTLDVPVTNPQTNITSIKKTPINYYYSAFDQTRITLFDFDISACDDQIRSKHLRFALQTDLAMVIKTHLSAFKQGLMLSIENTALVTLLRISQLELIFETNQIYAVFTLLDRPRVYGNVNRTREDLSLDDAFKRLNNLIAADAFIVSFAVNSTLKYGVKAIKDSLIELERRDGQYVYNQVIFDDNSGYSGGSVAAITIIMLIVGLALGLVVGIFLILKRSGNLPGPLGFLNPNFKQASSTTA